MCVLLCLWCHGHSRHTCAGFFVLPTVMMRTPEGAHMLCDVLRRWEWWISPLAGFLCGALIRAELQLRERMSAGWYSTGHLNSRSAGIPLILYGELTAGQWIIPSFPFDCRNRRACSSTCTPNDQHVGIQKMADGNAQSLSARVKSVSWTLLSNANYRLKLI